MKNRHKKVRQITQTDRRDLNKLDTKRKYTNLVNHIS